LFYRDGPLIKIVCFVETRKKCYILKIGEQSLQAYYVDFYISIFSKILKDIGIFPSLSFELSTLPKILKDEGIFLILSLKIVKNQIV